MASKIEERFVVQAPADQVWAYLVDPRQVVTCLPGAELVEVVDDRTFLGKVKVKVGPVTVAYRGRVVLMEIDEVNRQVRMSGEGREGGGTGTARMAMQSAVVALPDGGAEVRVSAEVDVAGRLVQLGRGMIEQVSHQVFAQFAQCVRRTLEARAPAAAAAAEGAAAPSLAAATAGGIGTAGHGAPPLARPPVEPVRALPLLWRALVATVVTWLRRLRSTRRRAGEHHAAPRQTGHP